MVERAPAARTGVRWVAMPRSHPWALVPAAECEADLVRSGERELLATLFGKVYAARRPRRLAVLGVGTGDGLEHVDVRVTGRTVGVDLNLSCLAVARQRHMRLGATLELLCADLEAARLPAGAFDLVHAALVLEYVDPAAAIGRLAGWLAPGGAASFVVALEGGEPPPPPGAALRAALAAARAVPPEELRARCAAAGLEELRAFVVPLPAGRRVFAALYERPRRG